MGVNQSLFDSLCSRAGFGDLKPNDRSGDKPYSGKLFGMS